MENHFYSYPDLEGKSVVITGAAKGIGKSIAEAFISNECKVIAMYRSTPPDFDKAIMKQGPEPDLLKLDIQDIESAKEWMGCIDDDHQSIDVLVNNAGINNPHELIEVGTDEWDRLFSVNTRATFFLSQLFAKHMSCRNGGVIINATSFAAKLPSLRYGVYAASKAALLSLTKSMAAEWAEFNIRVNAYSPGVILTDMTSPTIGKNKDMLLSQISQGAFGMPHDVANSVLFLASNASSYITGSEIDISGGKFIVQTAR
jgi:3-oxoacyl-[acyl-carrier protein] reductase